MQYGGEGVAETTGWPGPKPEQMDTKARNPYYLLYSENSLGITDSQPKEGQKRLTQEKTPPKPLQLWGMVIDREAWQAAVHGVTESWTRQSDWATINHSRQIGVSL